MDDRRERFNRVYDTYGKALYRICAAHIGRSDAEDVLQEAFIRYLRRDRPFRDEEHERRWLIRVCINLCRDRRRAGANDDWAFPEAIPSPDAYAESDLLETVRQLPPKLRSVIVLHCCEGYTLEETSKILGAGLSAVKMRLTRAREKLKMED